MEQDLAQGGGAFLVNARFVINRKLGFLASRTLTGGEGERTQHRVLENERAPSPPPPRSPTASAPTCMEAVQ